MNKKELIKNKYDLEYHGESSKANVYLTLSTLGVSGFIGTFLFLKNNEGFILGLILTFIIFILGIIMYRKKSKRMTEILSEIENI